MTTKYDRIPNTLFIKNRKKFITQMKTNSIAIFNSNDIYPISADSTLAFQQHRDIFYLSGVDQEESILLIFPNAYKEEYREILFVRETNDHIAVWEGEKLSKEDATEVSGIKTVMWLSEFEKVFYDLMAEAENIYLNKNEHYRAAVETQTREDRFIEFVKKQYPLHTILRSNPILQRLRSIKEPEEIALIQHACDITEKGIRRLLGFVKPGIWEYEIEAELAHEFIKNRSHVNFDTKIVSGAIYKDTLNF